MSLYDTISKFVEEDAEHIANQVAHRTDRPAEVDADIKADNDDDNLYHVTYNCYVDGELENIEIDVDYWKDGEEYLMSDDISSIASQISQLVLSSKNSKKGKVIKSSKSTILAAEEDEDPFADIPDEDLDFGDDSLDDTLEDISDSIEDMQDSLDEIVEDDPSIEIDNNIANHYIAECEKCKGVFISAIIESDQSVEHISGQCPLCGKDSDQYLKWVVRDIHDVE